MVNLVEHMKNLLTCLLSVRILRVQLVPLFMPKYLVRAVLERTFLLVQL